jgi:uncharacterized protein (DUF934 family)
MNFIDQALPADVLTFENTEDVTTHAGEVKAALRIALRFPKWTDGRAYSQARLLRSRLSFAGEIVATGEVLVDMLPMLQRSGFDAVQLRADQDRGAAERALGFFAGHYQADLVSKLPLFARLDH